MQGPWGNLSARPGKLTFTTGHKALAAIRPEKIRISSEKPIDGNAVEGVMDETAYLGDRSHYYVRINGVENPVAVSAQNLDPDQFFSEGHLGTNMAELV